MPRIRLRRRRRQRGSLRGTSSVPGPRMGAPRSHQSIGGLLLHLAGGELDIAHVAELPELFRGTGVLRQDLVDVERIEFTDAEAVSRLGYVRDVRLVVARHNCVCLPTVCLPGQPIEAVANHRASEWSH
jgi:hypothetical protein